MMKRKILLLSFIASMTTVANAQFTPALTDAEATERYDVQTMEVDGFWWLTKDGMAYPVLAYMCTRRDVMDTEWLRATGSYSGDVVIPETVNGQAVTGIYEFTFDGCGSLTSVTLPSTLKTIGAFAFFRSSLPEITIPSNVTTIGEDAFYCENLKKVVIEDGEEVLKMYSHHNGTANPWGALGWGQFAAGAQPLEEAYIGRVVETVDDYPLFYGSSVRRVTFSDIVKEIPESWFAGCEQLESVQLGNGIGSIGNNAFDGCKKLPAIDLPDGVTSIGNGAFNQCEALSNVRMPSDLRTIGEYAFSGTALQTITIPGGVEEIGDYALSIESLRKIVIEDGETPLKIGFNGYGAMFSSSASEMGMKLEDAYVGRNIDTDLFHGNTTIRRITFGDKVTTICANYCVNCPVLETIVLGKGVNTIGEEAFASWEENGSSLCAIYCHATVPPVCANESVFNNVNKQTCKLYVPEGAVEAYKAADVWKDFFNIEVSGVNAAQSDGTAICEIYTLSGQRASSQHRGLAIQRMSNGATRKVISGGVRFDGQKY